MLNVLIVDDEPYIRQGLRLLIDWEAEGFRLMGEASDGTEALEIMKYSPVDLLITDIQMPEMDGLQLMSRLRENGRDDVYFVILSGYREFEYVQKAMKYGCSDYILKPINRDELLTVLGSIRQKLEREQSEREEEERRSHAVFERNVLALITGKFDTINLSHVKEHTELEGGIRYINIELDMFDKRSEALSDGQLRVLQRTLFEGLRRVLGRRSCNLVFDVSKRENCYDVGLIYCEKMAEELNMTEPEYFAWLSERAESVVDNGVIIQVGGEVDSIERLAESFRSSNIAKFMQSFRENGALSVADEQEFGGDISHESYLKMKLCADAVVSAVDQCSREEIEKAVDALYRQMGETYNDYRLISMNLNNILLRLMHIAVERDSNLNQQEAVNYIIRNAFDKGVVRGSAAHFAAFCCDYADFLMQIKSHSAVSMMGAVEREIARNYATNISLKQLGEQFFINSAYLGQLFRKNYGVSFKDYLNMVRINNAAELLANTDMKVYEVSAAVGYQSVDYFIGKFVALRGHTPTQFRKNIHSHIET